MTDSLTAHGRFLDNDNIALLLQIRQPRSESYLMYEVADKRWTRVPAVCSCNIV
jgi:hypothetical protein